MGQDVTDAERFLLEQARRTDQAWELTKNRKFTPLFRRMRDACFVEPRHHTELTLDRHDQLVRYVSFNDLCALLAEFRPREINAPFGIQLVPSMGGYGKFPKTEATWTYELNIRLPEDEPLIRISHGKEVFCLPGINPVLARLNGLGYSCARVQQYLARKTAPRDWSDSGLTFLRDSVH